MNKQKILASALCVCLILLMTLSGCGKAESTPDEADIAITTTAFDVTTIPLTESLKTEAETEERTEADSQKATEQVYVPDYNLEDAEDISNDPCTVNVDGKSYTFYTGDVINYVYYLQTPEALEDFQATTYYDGSMLEIIDTGEAQMFPVAGAGAVYNTEMPNCIKFNAVDINGMDFTSGGSLVSFKFRILDSGSVAISTTLEYMDSVKSEPYVNDFKIIGDIKYSEEII